MAWHGLHQCECESEHSDEAKAADLQSGCWGEEPPGNAEH